MIPHIHTLFEFTSIPYENQHQTLKIKKIDRGQIKLREYSIRLLQPYVTECCGHTYFIAFIVCLYEGTPGVNNWPDCEAKSGL